LNAACLPACLPNNFYGLIAHNSENSHQLFETSTTTATTTAKPKKLVFLLAAARAAPTKKNIMKNRLQSGQFERDWKGNLCSFCAASLSQSLDVRFLISTSRGQESSLVAAGFLEQMLILISD